jgi:Tol biopolymer transport system component
MPSFLPDGRHFIYMRRSTTPENTGIYVGSLDAKPEEQSVKQLVATRYGAAYVPSSDPGMGHLLFVRDRTLMAEPFDARRLELAGDAVALAEGVGTVLSSGFFSASTNGVLAYRAGGSGNFQQLTWYDPQGKALGTAGEPYTFALSLALSPDGTRVALARLDTEHFAGALWLLDFSLGTSTRFTFGSSGSSLAAYAVWSPDGSRIIFTSNPEGHYDLYQKPASGATDEELLLKSSENKMPTSWSGNGRFLLYTATDPKTKDDLWVLPLDGDKKPFPFLRTEFNERSGRFSPDGRWVAYSSDESGSMEVYVRSFSPDSGGTAPGIGGKWLISANGGILPRWRGDGKELYYRTLDGALMAVEVSTSPVFRAGVPKTLFQMPLLNSRLLFSVDDWDVTTDGRRFLTSALTAQSEQAPFTVVLNWQAALKK